MSTNNYEMTALAKLLDGKEKGDVSAAYDFIAFADIVDEVADQSIKDLRDGLLDELSEREDPKGMIMKASHILSEENLSVQDVHTAFNYNLLAALKGELFGIECLADMFFEGREVEQSYQTAYYLLYFCIKYSQNPNALCFYELGKIAKEGFVFPADQKLAKYCFEKAIQEAGEYATMDEYAIKAQEELDAMNK